MPNRVCSILRQDNNEPTDWFAFTSTINASIYSAGHKTWSKVACIKNATRSTFDYVFWTAEYLLYLIYAPCTPLDFMSFQTMFTRAFLFAIKSQESWIFILAAVPWEIRDRSREGRRRPSLPSSTVPSWRGTAPALTWRAQMRNEIVCYSPLLFFGRINSAKCLRRLFTLHWAREPFIQ